MAKHLVLNIKLGGFYIRICSWSYHPAQDIGHIQPSENFKPLPGNPIPGSELLS